jgi:uncharacterized protein YpuA (DUF1002 family)
MSFLSNYRINQVRNDLDLILEETLFNESNNLDLSKGRNSLVEIDQKLKDLIDK